jgi:hypothetical protein
LWIIRKKDQMQKCVSRGLAVAVLSLSCACPFAQNVQSGTGAIGDAVVVVGHVTLHGANTDAPLARGAAIMQGSTIETGADGYVYIATVDNGFISVRPSSSLTIERYEYDAAAPERTVIKLALHNGVVREISGKGAQAARDHYRMNTPVAALGVRGTDFSVFTDANVTRADVRSGGIVMTPLGNDCSANGIGPCEGKSSAQLFADHHGVLLQVNRGSDRPAVIDARLSHLIPDQVVPALKSEDSAARAAITPAPVTPGVTPDELSFPPSPAAPPTSQAPAPTVTPAAPAPAPEAQQIFWGRFAPLASLPTNTTVAALLQQGSELVGTFEPFAMTRLPQPDMVMPAYGSFAFGLQNYEAYVVNATSGAAIPAAISNALLSIDFGAHTFTTSLNLSANGTTYVLTGYGGVAGNGQMNADYASTLHVQGTVAGNHATQAGYVFWQGLNSNNSAVGATLWSR